jgi:hypothetical protein
LLKVLLLLLLLWEALPVPVLILQTRNLRMRTQEEQLLE